jgi:hypothetical protein
MAGGADETELRPDMGAQPRFRRFDASIPSLAARQHGVVSRSQLAALGLGRRAIGHRVECGRLHAVHRGVFAVGHAAISGDARWMAAVLAAGPGAALSHRSAAALWGVRGTARGRIEVTAPRKAASRPGLQLHHALLASDEVGVHRGIPVTSTPRTLLDLASVLAPQALERAVDEAEVLRLTDALSLADLMGRHPRSRGAVALRRIVEAGRIGATITRSELEDRFLALLDGAGLPRPHVNVPLEHAYGWIEADCAWLGRRIVVELDGYASHGTGRRSIATAHAIEPYRSRAGGSSGSPGGICTTRPAPSRRSCGRCSRRRDRASARHGGLDAVSTRGPGIGAPDVTFRPTRRRPTEAASPTKGRDASYLRSILRSPSPSRQSSMTR